MSNERVAHHEAGHVVAHWFVSEKLSHVEIIEHEGGPIGVTHSRPDPPELVSHWTRDQQLGYWRRRALIAAAGPAAESRKTGVPPANGTDACDQQALDEACDAIAVLDGSSVQSVQAWAQEQAQFLIEDHARSLDRVAEQLLSRRRLTSEECIQLCNGDPQPRVPKSEESGE